VPQTSYFPLNELVGRPYDEGTQEVERGVNKGCHQGEGGRGESGNDFGGQEQDIGNYVDIDSPLCSFFACSALLSLVFWQ